MKKAWLALTALIILGPAGCGDVPRSVFGAWELDDGTLLSVRQSTGETLRVRVYQDGSTRRFHRDGSQWSAGPGIAQDVLTETSITFDGDEISLHLPDGTSRSGSRVQLEERWARVLADGVELNARLTVPPGPGPHPTVILVQGSGDDAATRTYGTADFLAANGFATVVYDKRGTGESGGRYTHDFYRLADDAASVAEWASQQPGLDPDRIGISGYSQGGWVGPLAAARSDRVAWVIANYGMIDSPRSEEVQETVAAVARRGVDGPALEQVRELSQASVDVLAAEFGGGWDRFDSIAARYRDAPWMDHLEGTTIGAFLRYPHWMVKLVGPFMAPRSIPWDYDSRETLDRLAARGIPVVWMIAELDRSAPNGFTLQEVERRIQAGEPTHLRLFAGVDHGFVTFVEAADGTRTYGNYHPDFFSAEVGWARRLAGLE
jgi:dienelactone hydrolase